MIQLGVSATSRTYYHTIPPIHVFRVGPSHTFNPDWLCLHLLLPQVALCVAGLVGETRIYIYIFAMLSDHPAPTFVLCFG